MPEVTQVQDVPSLPERVADSHKGNYGTVLVVAGSRGMAGAAVLCGRAALRSGAGLVRVACPIYVQDIVATGYPGYTTYGIRQHTDGTFGDGAAEDLVQFGQEATVVVLGPGIGREPATVAFVRRFITELPEIPIVLDADGLFAVSPFQKDWARRKAPLVLTPHAGEFARLTGQPIVREHAQRVQQAVQFAGRFGQPLLLKGHRSLVTDGHRLYTNTTGNPGMATGGSGDVLAGVVGALIGLGLSAFDAACLGASVHGRAGDIGAARLGQTALTATDILEELPAAFREREAGWSQHRNTNS